MSASCWTRQPIKKQRYYLANKDLSSQSYGLSSGHVWMWELDYKESWALNRWCFWTLVLRKTLESPLDCKIKPIHPKGNQSWMFIGRTDAEAETPILWSPGAKNWLIGKDLDAGKDWRQEEKGMTEDEMVGWHHWLDGHESEQAPGVGDGDGQEAWHAAVHEIAESDKTEQLNWTELLDSIWGIPNKAQKNPMKQVWLECPFWGKWKRPEKWSLWPQVTRGVGCRPRMQINSGPTKPRILALKPYLCTKFPSLAPLLCSHVPILLQL